MRSVVTRSLFRENDVATLEHIASVTSRHMTGKLCVRNGSVIAAQGAPFLERLVGRRWLTVFDALLRKGYCVRIEHSRPVRA